MNRHISSVEIMRDIDEIKARLDIVQYIGEHVSLKKAGRTYKGLCPFHGEKTPSFTVFPESQNWHCFGCGEGGDIFTFAMKREGWDFVEALEALAQRAGVTLAPRGDRTPEQVEQYDRLRALLAEAATYYHHLLLNAPEAQFAREYIQTRQLNDETVRAFTLGYAPNSWDATRRFLQSRGYAEEHIAEAGLMVVREEEGKRYDRFRHRLMIPIRDGRGRTVGFGARALAPDAVPKYLNSPQTPLFDKSRFLYGLDMSRRTIRETETAVLVEGYMDVMQAHQAGYTDLVAQMGTALTETQLEQLGRYARRLILALDPDAAGMKATMRDLEVARGLIRQGGRLNLDIRVLRLPEGKDPDALIREGPDAWRRLIEEALPVAEYVIRQATAGRDLSSPLERERIARELLPILTAAENEVHEYTNLQALARVTRVHEQTLIRWAASQTSPKPPRRTARKEPPPKAAAHVSTARQERYCIAALFQRPGMIYRVDRRLQELGLARLNANDFTQPDAREIFTSFLAALAQVAQEPVDYVYRTLPPVLAQVLDAYLQSEAPGDLDDENVLERALSAFLRLRKVSIQRQHDEIHMVYIEALEAGDLTRAEELGTIISRYVQQIRRLEAALPHDRNAVKLF